MQTLNITSLLSIKYFPKIARGSINLKLVKIFYFKHHCSQCLESAGLISLQSYVLCLSPTPPPFPWKCLNQRALIRRRFEPQYQVIIFFGNVAQIPYRHFLKSRPHIVKVFLCRNIVSQFVTPGFIFFLIKTLKNILTLLGSN